MNTNKVKSGFLTSEFWLIVLTAALPILGYVEQNTQGAAMLIAASVYALARSIVKAKQVT